MARLLKYLQFRDYKSKLLKSLEDDDAQQETGKHTRRHIKVFEARVTLSFYFFSVCRAATAAAGGNQRRQRLAQDFLVWMDQTGDLLSLAERQEVDPVKQERMEVRRHHGVFSVFVHFRLNMMMIVTSLSLQRLERQTRAMDQAQYSEFCESRQLSFGENQFNISVHS